MAAALHFGVLSLAWAPLGGHSAAIGDAAPDFVLKSTAGPNLRLSEYRGRVVLVGFWASWCSDCRPQLRELEALRTALEGSELELLAVSVDAESHQAEDAAEGLRLGFPVLHDVGGAVAELYDVDRMPYLVMLDRDGVVRADFSGYRRGDEDDYLAQATALLEE